MAQASNKKSRSAKAQDPSESAGAAGAGAGGALVPVTAQMPAGYSDDFLQRMREKAKAAAAAERPQQSKLSIKSGILSYDGSPLPDNEMEVVVVASAFFHAMYIDPYNQNRIALPRCFSLALPEVAEDGSLKEPKMEAHENVLEEPYRDIELAPGKSCDTCEFNAWGSDPLGGRGKACKERRRLALIPADALKSVIDVKNAELSMLDLPVMSVKNWSAYVNKVAALMSLPYNMVTTKIKVVPDPRSQYKVTFEPANYLPSEEILNAVISREEQGQRMLLTPFASYTPPEDEPAPQGNKKFTR